MKVSTTYVAGIVAVIAFVLPLVGYDIGDAGLLKNSTQELVGALAVLYTFYGRYRAGGINAFGVKKK